MRKSEWKCFTLFLSKQATKNWNSKNCIRIVLLPWKFILLLRFFHFCKFLLISLNSMPSKIKNVKIWKKWNFLLYLAYNSKKLSQKNCKNQKTQRFESIEWFVSILTIAIFCSLFKKKMAKTCFFQFIENSWYNHEQMSKLDFARSFLFVCLLVCLFVCLFLFDWFFSLLMCISYIKVIYWHKIVLNMALFRHEIMIVYNFFPCMFR